MGGGGKKGGGGGGGNVPDFNIPQGLLQGAASTTGLGQYGTALLNPLAAMTGWASSLATGQNVQVPTPQGFAIQAGPSALHHGTGKSWATQFDPTTGLITFTNPGNPRQTFQSDLAGAQKNFDLPPQVIQQWQQDASAYQQYQSGQPGGAFGAGGPPSLTPPAAATASVLPAQSGTTDFQNWYNQNYGKTVYVNGQVRTLSNQDLDPNQALAAHTQGALSWKTPAGGQQQLALAWQDIQAQQAATGQMPGIEAQTQAAIDRATAEAGKFQHLGDVQQAQVGQFFKTAGGQEAQAQKFFQTADAQEQQAQALFGVGYNELSQADKQIVDANALVKMTTTGEGLFPAQQAMIDQARKSEEQQLASTLGAVGLGRSTQLAQMTGAADQAAAATAGQLQQGNIQAAELVVSGALGQQAGAQKTLGLAQAGAQTAAQTAGLGISEQQVAGQTYGLGLTQEQVAQQSYQLSQAAEKLSLAGQELLAGEQAQLTQELQNITTQSVQFQQAMWGEAMQGYGLMGDIISRSSQSYGYSLSAYTSVLQAMEEHSQTQVGLQEAAMKADQQGSSDLLGGLGQLFGSGGAGTNLLGGLGGLIGGGGAAVGGAAAAGAGAAGTSLGTAGALGLVGLAAF